MYQTHKTYMKPGMKMLDLINENHSLLSLLQHFEIDFVIDYKTIEQLCDEYKISLQAFLSIGNLYNGFFPDHEQNFGLGDIDSIIKFLKNNHKYYKEEKYPEIKNCIKKLHKNHNTKDIELIETFFNEYFHEVLEHLHYEDEIVFPYFHELVGESQGGRKHSFSVKQYREHHTDIETKLCDLQNLMLKHIHLQEDLSTRKQFLDHLFELDFDLKIHSTIEDRILIPIIEKIENNENDK